MYQYYKCRFAFVVILTILLNVLDYKYCKHSFYCITFIFALLSHDALVHSVNVICNSNSEVNMIIIYFHHSHYLSVELSRLLFTSQILFAAHHSITLIVCRLVTIQIIDFILLDIYSVMVCNVSWEVQLTCVTHSKYSLLCYCVQSTHNIHVDTYVNFTWLLYHVKQAIHLSCVLPTIVTVHYSIAFSVTIIVM